MKISMHILEHWLAAYEPLASIVDGGRHIETVQFVNDSARFLDDCLCVGRVSDFFQQSDSRSVLIANRNDVIELKTEDMYSVFNDIIAAFDYFSGLDEKIRLAAVNIMPEQVVISLFEELLGPLYIVTPDFRIIACSRKSLPDDCDGYWARILHDREFSIEMVDQMLRGGTTIDLMRRNPSMVEFYEPMAPSYRFGIMDTYYALEGTVIGYLVASSREAPTSFEKDLVGCLSEALGYVQMVAATVRSTPAFVLDDEAMLSGLLDGSDTLRSSAYLESMYSIPKNASYRLVTTVQLDESLLVKVKREMSVMFLESVSTVRYGRAYLLLWDTDMHDDSRLRRRLRHLTENASVRVGVSNQFSSLPNLRHYVEQSLLASDDYGLGGDPQMDAGIEGGGDVVFFSQVAVRHFPSIEGYEKRMCARHPAVSVLERIDEEDGSELVPTLRDYLICGRSISRAAKRLHVHRNTVTYRINRIVGMNLFDIEDDDERLYVMLSLLVRPLP